MRKNLLALCAGLVFLMTFSLAAQEDDDAYIPTYVLGDQMLMINGGLFTPLFYQTLSGDIHSTHLTVGGVGSIQWSGYLNNDMSIGAEGGGMFAFTPNDNNLFMLPVTIRYSYFLRKYPFDFPLSIAAGVNFLRLNSVFRILPILKPGISAYWNYDSSWAFGLNIFYWWTPDLYAGPEPPQEHSRFGNFIEFSLSARYHF
ncbi:MAG: hypothetical protein LBQ61_06060 [Spirochaetales bacterium]|jgi:hypothetical protein|nr:hypothetical protein [Spirochaetales bacterium]